PGYCRLDRRGHWLLLSPQSQIQSESNNIVTSSDKKYLTKDSNHEQIFPDSCESLTVSVDLHVPTDELITYNDDIDGQNTLVGRHKIRQYQNITPNNIPNIS
ncbi:unnamed protein product, partial [Adineta steineri]